LEDVAPQTATASTCNTTLNTCTTGITEDQVAKILTEVLAQMKK
jgi:hypothetical protein